MAVRPAPELLNGLRRGPATGGCGPGLANRALFRDRLEHTLMRRNATGVYVLFLDIDHFKEINDSFGHSQGDVPLVEVSYRLKGCVRAEDTIARLGGDEFAILIERGTTDDAVTVATRIGEAMRRGAFSLGRSLEVTASIGIAENGPDARDAETLLRNADLAMYDAKSMRRAKRCTPRRCTTSWGSA